MFFPEEQLEPYGDPDPNFMGCFINVVQMVHMQYGKQESGHKNRGGIKEDSIDHIHEVGGKVPPSKRLHVLPRNCKDPCCQGQITQYLNHGNSC